jgi:hypothetical protein
MVTIIIRAHGHLESNALAQGGSSAVEFGIGLRERLAARHKGHDCHSGTSPT